MDPVTRRNFIKGVIAAGAVASSAAYLFRGPAALLGQPSAPGSVERLITLNVNGQTRRVDVMKQETLAMTLRYKLGLTGTKLGCDRAECGACTVLIDDVPHYSCSVLTHTVRGRNGRHDRRAGRVRRAAASGAAGGRRRAGLPVRVLHARLRDGRGRLPQDRTRTPTRAELAHGISGNLCRCQDYDKILTALMRGAEYMRRACDGGHEAHRQQLHAARSRRQGHRPREVRGGLPRRRHAVLQAAAQPDAARARARASTRARRWRCPASRRSSPPTICRSCDGAETRAHERAALRRASRFSPSRPSTS